jgi:hypothetical protein
MFMNLGLINAMIVANGKNREYAMDKYRSSNLINPKAWDNYVGVNNDGYGGACTKGPARRSPERLWNIWTITQWSSISDILQI